MKKSIFLSLITFLTTVFVVGCNPKTETMTEHPLDNLYLSTSSESQERTDRLLPREGTEDASHVLGDWQPDLPVGENDSEEYRPNTSVEWVIDVKFPEDETAKAEEVASMFDESFRNECGSCSLYGKDANSGLWTFLISADGPESVTGLQVAFDYQQSWNSNFATANVMQYEARLKAVEKIASKMFGQCIMKASRSPSEAFRYAESLDGLSDKYDHIVSLYLLAEQDRLFEGMDIWDVMLCLGLEWGDMDCFHWINNSNTGDDFFFSVETSTPPGYFLPEQIASDQLKTRDLIFCFSVARTVQPTEITKKMDEAVQYCQSRLGGKIHYVLGEDEVSKPELIERVGQIESELTEIGFEPGSDAALQMF
ncbi:MAG: cell division protein ZipA C-terminal FtsZ-binding domain-containing protein [Planctomycetota bacterium]